MADGVGAEGGGNRHGYWLLKVGVFSVLLGFGRKMSFAVKRADSGWD